MDLSGNNYMKVDKSTMSEIKSEIRMIAGEAVAKEMVDPNSKINKALKGEE
jgi:hypothetical protein